MVYELQLSPIFLDSNLEWNMHLNKEYIYMCFSKHGHWSPKKVALNVTLVFKVYIILNTDEINHFLYTTNMVNNYINTNIHVSMYKSQYKKMPAFFGLKTIK